MAMVLAIPYVEVCLAATIPTVLYYWGLFVQADAFAARKGLKGLDRSEIKPVGKTLKSGWPYIGSLVVLMFFLFTLRLEAEAPFYATAFLLGYAMLKKSTRLSLKTW